MITAISATATIRDSRSTCGRRFPAKALYRIYVGKGAEPVDVLVMVTWETPTAFKIRALQAMTIPSPTREIKAGEILLVSKRSIVFLEG